MEIIVAGLVVTLLGGLTMILRKVSRRAFEQENAIRDPWREFAARHGLTFISGHYQVVGASQLAYITGTYRGCHLKLDTYHEHEQIFGRGEVKTIYTRLVISMFNAVAPEPDLQPIDWANEPISPEVIGERLSEIDVSALSGRPYLQADGQEIYYEQRHIEMDLARLQTLFDTMVDLANCYTQIIDLGGAAIDPLQKLGQVASASLQTNATQLIRGIALKTTSNLGYRAAQLLCPHCLTRFGAHSCRLSAINSITFIGCRLCQQSRSFWQGQVVAILDRDNLFEPVASGGFIRVNWLKHRNLFDFDTVEIIQATDEEVERFAVQVGNDTDPYRRPKYKSIPCTLIAPSGLSKNSIRVLQQMFGSVVQR